MLHDVTPEIVYPCPVHLGVHETPLGSTAGQSPLSPKRGGLLASHGAEVGARVGTREGAAVGRIVGGCKDTSLWEWLTAVGFTMLTSKATLLGQRGLPPDLSVCVFAVAFHHAHIVAVK